MSARRPVITILITETEFVSDQNSTIHIDSATSKACEQGRFLASYDEIAET